MVLWSPFAQALRKSFSSAVTRSVLPNRVVISKITILWQAAIDIMEKQGGLLADRPHLIAAGEMLNGGLALGLVPAGERWRRMRRFVVCDAFKDRP
jgi:hypothetical protein